jgi:tRNA threonylcarbamoyladenosine biosynthesis protein TsaB
LDGYVATRGPGSFTGLRIGLGTVRGLALAAGKPCGGVVTLQAMAEARGPTSIDRAPIIDGGRGELFYARYSATGSPPAEQAEPAAAPVAAALAACREALLLPAADGRTAQLAAAAAPEVRAAPPVRGVAAAAARLALLLPEVFEDPVTMHPLYLRASDAELNLRSR